MLIPNYQSCVSSSAQATGNAHEMEDYDRFTCAELDASLEYNDRLRRNAGKIICGIATVALIGLVGNNVINTSIAPSSSCIHQTTNITGSCYSIISQENNASRAQIYCPSDHVIGQQLMNQIMEEGKTNFAPCVKKVACPAMDQYPCVRRSRVQKRDTNGLKKLKKKFKKLHR